MSAEEYKPGDLDEALDAARESVGHVAKVGMRFLSALVGAPDPTVGPDPRRPETTEPGGQAWTELTRILMAVADALSASHAYTEETGSTTGNPMYRIDGPAILRAAERAGRAKDYARSAEERGTERRAVLVTVDDRDPTEAGPGPDTPSYLAGLTEAAWLAVLRSHVSERTLRFAREQVAVLRGHERRMALIYLTPSRAPAAVPETEESLGLLSEHGWMDVVDRYLRDREGS